MFGNKLFLAASFRASVRRIVLEPEVSCQLRAFSILLAVDLVLPACSWSLFPKETVLLQQIPGEILMITGLCVCLR